jgi:cob(I)alamin adenosyltransferase
MSVFIFSKKGDQGTTSLLTGERISKASLRPDAYGTLDEASSALGLAKTFTLNETILETIQAVQEDLLMVGARLSDTASDSEYSIGTERIQRLEEWIVKIQEEVPIPRRFIYPGVNSVSASIDLARSIIRRAERVATALKEAGEIDSPEVHAYLNRLADFLFILARYAEKKG